MINSTLYTIGTALMRAKDAEVSVELLVAGQWLYGYVSAVDGHGVMLVGDNDEVSVVRVEQVVAVKVTRGSAFEGRPEVEAHPGATSDYDQYEAHPMPAASRDR